MNTPVDSKSVTGRRELHFDSVDQIVADAEQLAARPHVQLGNWTLGEICDHLAKAFDSATDDNQFRPGPLIRLLGPMLKRRILSRPLPAGFRMREGMKPIFMPAGGTSTDDGLARLRAAVERFKAGPLPPRSPSFGTMSRDDWHQFHCRHAELHLSFIVPQET